MAAAARVLENKASGLPLSAHILDVTDQSSIDRTVAEALDANGIDVLVNNAGFALRGPVVDLRDDELLRQFDTNVFGVVRMARAVVPSMRERGGWTIVNVSSCAGLIGVPFEGAYVASKHALEGLSEVMRLELAASRIAVRMVEPGSFSNGFEDNIKISTGFTTQHLQQRDYERFFAWREETFENGTPPDPQAVVDAVLEAVDHPDGPLRRPVGADAEMVMALRRNSTFEDYERAVQTALRDPAESTTQTPGS